MKYRLYRTDAELTSDELYLLPTINFRFNNRAYFFDNFSIEFHFLSFHARWVFVDDSGYKGLA